MDLQILTQFVEFMFVGAIGVVINAIAYGFLMRTKFGQKKVFDRFKNHKFLSKIEEFFGLKAITLAWGLGILIACVSNFILNKWWVFQ